MFGLSAYGVLLRNTHLLCFVWCSVTPEQDWEGTRDSWTCFPMLFFSLGINHLKWLQIWNMNLALVRYAEWIARCIYFEARNRVDIKDEKNLKNMFQILTVNKYEDVFLKVWKNSNLEVDSILISKNFSLFLFGF